MNTTPQEPIHLFAHMQTDELTILHSPLINLTKQSHLWYDDECVLLMYQGYRFMIEAVGNVEGTLLDKDTGDVLEEIKTTYHGNNFSDVMHAYCQQDADLQLLLNDDHHFYELELTLQNAWECWVTKPNGEEVDSIWVIGEDRLEDAIQSVINTLKKGIIIDGHWVQLNH